MLDQLKAACTTAHADAIVQEAARLNLPGTGIIGTIISIIQKYGPLAEQLLPIILAALPPGSTLSTILTALEALLQAITGTP